MNMNELKRTQLTTEINIKKQLVQVLLSALALPASNLSASFHVEIEGTLGSAQELINILEEELKDIKVTDKVKPITKECDKDWE